MTGKLRTNCGCSDQPKASCQCGSGLVGHRLRTHLAKGSWRIETYDGRETLVVPLVMAKANIVMNDALLPVEEFAAPAWDGVPVTVGHPATENGFVSASATPETHAQWVIGRVFNTKVEGIDLKGEAWIDTEKANKVHPGLVESLKDPECRMNVSTGFFAADQASPGMVGNRSYGIVSRNIRPNHLALLPFEDGACSWDDGCGVRTNKETGNMAAKVINEKVSQALATLGSALGLKPNVELKAFVAEDEAERKRLFDAIGKMVTNERGEDTDRRQMIADLISNNDSPFVPDDEDSLRLMSEKTLSSMASAYLKKNEDGGEMDDEGGEMDDEGGEDDDPMVTNATRRKLKDPSMRSNERPHVMKKQELVDLVTNAAAEAARKAVSAVLSAEDREALKVVRVNTATHRNQLVDKIVANSSFKPDQLTKYSLDQLTEIAANVSAGPDYSGRRIATNASAEALGADESVKSMKPASSFRPNKRLAG